MDTCRVLPMLGLALLAAPISAQTRPADKDVVVESTRLPPGKPSTEVRAGTSTGVANRVVFENSQRIAKCAMRTSLPKLRAAIDGAPNSADQRSAQAWLIRRTTTCNADAAIVSREPWDEGNVLAAVRNSLSDSQSSTRYGVTTTETAANQSIAGTLIYDRGALFEQVLRTYAPEVGLTEEQTGNAAVQQRFDLRERPRNGYRQPEDLEYFKVAVCMVRMQPRMAVRLYQASSGSREQGRLQAMMIDNARACVGNARRVYVDSTQFRLYVIDALYRWVLAARNVPSLIPDDTVTAR